MYSKKCRLLLMIVYLLFSAITLSQTITNNEALIAFANKARIIYLKERLAVEEYSALNAIPIHQELPGGIIMSIERIENGIPVYNLTSNSGAVTTVQVDELWPGGSLNLNLTGTGYSKMAMWDGGKVRTTHQEFDGRVTHSDSWLTVYDHPTHVAGTIVAEGQDVLAKGMAYQADLDSYYWDDDISEMATAAAAGLELSNHSYVHGIGWYIINPYIPYWYGDLTISTTEEYRFGFYSEEAAAWDNIAYNAPYYLILKACGNDRNDDHVGEHRHAGDSVTLYYDAHDPDGGADRYECIPDRGVAKNILAVGAVQTVTNYSTPADVVMSAFSSWGPTDDGRIKPDLVAKGVSTYSAYGGSDSEYGFISGTSMATPNITGSMALLRQYYQSINSGARMRSATLKALAIHSANEAGTTLGPDYQFGWGLFSAKNAAELISLDNYGKYIIDEQVLNSGGTFTKNIDTNGLKPLKVTICWTDPPGTSPPLSLNPPTKMLVNDLDLRLIQDGTIYYPWMLDPNNPSNAATNSSENNVDNIEQVYIASPSTGTYTIEVDHDGILTNGSQAFSIIVSGNSECRDGSIIYNSDEGKFNFCENGYWVEK